MTKIYADEHFPRVISEMLRAIGYDVLTVQAAGNANQGIPDEEVLAFATSQNRSVITFNRFDFIRLHKTQPEHAGIIVCTDNPNRSQLVSIVDAAILANEPLVGKLIWIVRPDR
jgi:predicted nuclease of predicted toxin-antitoxin system